MREEAISRLEQDRFRVCLGEQSFPARLFLAGDNFEGQTIATDTVILFEEASQPAARLTLKDYLAPIKANKRV